MIEDQVVEEIRETNRLLKQLMNRFDMIIEAVHKAEQEVPEYMRRFTMYYHDIIHINARYEELGIPMPLHLKDEMERSHDRMRHLIEQENSQGGTFYKIREKMDLEMGNRFKHFRRDR
jgi:hypothetical protein